MLTNSINCRKKLSASKQAAVFEASSTTAQCLHHHPLILIRSQCMTALPSTPTILCFHYSQRLNVQKKKAVAFLEKAATLERLNEAFCHFIQSSSVENNKSDAFIRFTVRAVCFTLFTSSALCSYSVNSLITQNHFENCSLVAWTYSQCSAVQIFSNGLLSQWLGILSLSHSLPRPNSSYQTSISLPSSFHWFSCSTRQ